jgi:glycine cleavage system protein P-like pyridoxal-binding family
MLDDEKDNKPEMSSEERTIRFMSKLVAVTLLLIVAAMTSCTMHSNSYDAERLIEEAKVQQAENERTKMIEETKRRRIVATEALIKAGKNPVAVRCSLNPNLSRSEQENCHVLGLTIGKNVVDNK